MLQDLGLILTQTSEAGLHTKPCVCSMKKSSSNAVRTANLRTTATTAATDSKWARRYPTHFRGPKLNGAKAVEGRLRFAASSRKREGSNLENQSPTLTMGPLCRMCRQSSVILARVREILLVEEGDRVGEEDGRPLGDEVAGDSSAGGGPLLGHEGGDVGVAVALAQKGVQVPVNSYSRWNWSE